MHSIYCARCGRYLMRRKRKPHYPQICLYCAEVEGSKIKYIEVV